MREQLFIPPGSWLLAPEFFVYGSNCAVIGRSPANDKQCFAKEEKITLAIVPYPCPSPASGISGFFSYQSGLIFFLWGSHLSVETVG
jgi:hypothetical protein